MPAHTDQQRVDGRRGALPSDGLLRPDSSLQPRAETGADGPGVCLQDGGHLGQRRPPKAPLVLVLEELRRDPGALHGGGGWPRRSSCSRVITTST